MFLLIIKNIIGWSNDYNNILYHHRHSPIIENGSEIEKFHNKKLKINEDVYNNNISLKFLPLSCSLPQYYPLIKDLLLQWLTT